MKTDLTQAFNKQRKRARVIFGVWMILYTIACWAIDLGYFAVTVVVLGAFLASVWFASWYCDEPLAKIRCSACGEAFSKMLNLNPLINKPSADRVRFCPYCGQEL
jgi:DNA-directed RNA polymerase subunit RPC12/RpoP